MNYRDTALFITNLFIIGLLVAGITTVSKYERQISMVNRYCQDLVERIENMDMPMDTVIESVKNADIAHVNNTDNEEAPDYGSGSDA